MARLSDMEACRPSGVFADPYKAYRGFKLFKKQCGPLEGALYQGRVLAMNVMHLDYLQVVKATSGQISRPATFCKVNYRGQQLDVLILDAEAHAMLYGLRSSLSKYTATVNQLAAALNRLRGLSFDVSNAAHVRLLGICQNNVLRHVLGLAGAMPSDIYAELASVSLDHDLWRRVGFQGSNPVRDFRGAGVLGALAIAYFSSWNPDLFVNGSYRSKLCSKEDLRGFLKSPKAAYRYPISVSIITIANFLISHIGEAVYMLINECIIEQHVYLQNTYQLRQAVVTEANGGDDLLLSEAQFSGEEVYARTPRVVIEHLLKGDEALGFLAARHFMYKNHRFSSVSPSVPGVFLALVSRLTELLDSRLQKYTGDDVYLNYNKEFNAITQRSLEIMTKQFDVLGLDDFMQRIQE